MFGKNIADIYCAFTVAVQPFTKSWLPVILLTSPQGHGCDVWPVSVLCQGLRILERTPPNLHPAEAHSSSSRGQFISPPVPERVGYADRERSIQL